MTMVKMINSCDWLFDIIALIILSRNKVSYIINSFKY